MYSNRLFINTPIETRRVAAHNIYECSYVERINLINRYIIGASQQQSANYKICESAKPRCALHENSSAIDTKHRRVIAFRRIDEYAYRILNTADKMFSRFGYVKRKNY